MKKVKGAQSTFRKVRGVSDKTIQEALTNHQAVLKQLIGAYNEQQNQLRAVEEILKGMLEGMVEQEKDKPTPLSGDTVSTLDGHAVPVRDGDDQP